MSKAEARHRRRMERLKAKREFILAKRQQKFDDRANRRQARNDRVSIRQSNRTERYRIKKTEWTARTAIRHGERTKRKEIDAETERVGIEHGLGYKKGGWDVLGQGLQQAHEGAMAFMGAWTGQGRGGGLNNSQTGLEDVQSVDENVQKGSQTKIILIIGGAVAAAMALFFLLKKKKKK